MRNRREIAKDILYALGAVGLVAVALAAPNVIQLLRPKYSSRSDRYQVKRTLRLLKRDGLVSISEAGGKTSVRITKNGRLKILEYKVDDIQLKKPRIWDRRWRLVIFDIPVKMNHSRLAFVSKLREMGFVLMQRSVWLTPYPCEDEIDFLKEVYGLRSFVRMVTAESIDIQGDLFVKFGLNKSNA